MPFQLKDYQRRCLDELAQFLRRVIAHGRADLAFYEQTGRAYRQVRALPGLPYVCVRVPTGDAIVLVLDGSGAVKERYLQGPDIDQPLAEEDASGDVRWFLADQLGTVRDVVDSDGGLLNHVVYDTFGNVLSQTDAGEQPRFAFAGRELDAESGLYYNRLRYYDPAAGRFISEDPIGFAGGDGNLYRYVGNSPLNFIDPMGLSGGVWDSIGKALDYVCDYARGAGIAVLDANLGTIVEFVGKHIFDDSWRLKPPQSDAEAAGRRLGYEAAQLQGEVETAAGGLMMLEGLALLLGGGELSALGVALAPLTEGGSLVVEVVSVPATEVGAIEFVEGGLVAGHGVLVFQRSASNLGDGAGTTPPDAPKNLIPENESTTGHIFRDAEGHIADTPANRQLLTDVANDPSTTLGTDTHGTTWYAKTMPDGTQVWTQTRNGVIINGGVNQTPKTFNPQTGLSSPTKPE